MPEIKRWGPTPITTSLARPSRLLLLLLLIGVVCACSENRTGSADKARAGQDETVPLPTGMSPTALFTTNSPSLVIKAAGDAYHRSLYSWQSGKTPTLIIEGRDLDVTRLSDDVFAAWYSEKGQEKIVMLDGQKLISQPLALPNGGPTGWGNCEGNVQYVVCIGDRPGMSLEDKDYDELGFSAVLVIDFVQRKTKWFSVKDQTYFRFDPVSRMIFVINNWTDTSSPSPVEAFDLGGKPHESAHLKDVMPSSVTRQFVESVPEDGAESWDVYEAASMKALLVFNCNRPECKEGDRYDNQWNPKFTDQMVALREGGAFGKGGACDIYQLSPPHLMKTLPCGGLPVYDWSRDGRELVTLQYEGNILRREPVN